MKEESPLNAVIDQAGPVDVCTTNNPFVCRGALPNVCSLIGRILAVFFDWSDGIIARRTKRRTGVHGAQLDYLIDIVSFVN